MNDSYHDLAPISRRQLAIGFASFYCGLLASQSIAQGADISSATATASYGGSSRTLAAWTGDRVDITAYGADRTGQLDSSTAINAALLKAGTLGKAVWMPPGLYRCDKPLVCQQASPVVVEGASPTESVISVTHLGPALSFFQPSNLCKTTLRNIGFRSNALGLAQAAISITCPPSSSAALGDLVVSNISISSSPNSYFEVGLNLQGVWQSRVEDVTMINPGTAWIAGSNFIRIGGRSIDVRFVRCNTVGVDTAWLITGYNEGIHFEDSSANNVKIGYDSRNVNLNDGVTSPQSTDNSLALYLKNTKVYATETCGYLDRVTQGYIQDCTMAVTDGSQPRSTLVLTDSGFINCLNSQFYGAGAGLGDTALSFLTSNSSQQCWFNNFSQCTFSGIDLVASFGIGCRVNSVVDAVVLLNGAASPNRLVVDASGSGNNGATWHVGSTTTYHL